MKDIRSLLVSLGLEQYEDAFARNDVDLSALIEFGDDHLKELGVSLGHRVRLRKAISELRAEGGSAAPSEPRPPRPWRGRGARSR